jgi:hypothetical protein
MELIIGLSSTAAFWITAAIIVIRSNSKLKTGHKPKKNTLVRIQRFHPEVDRLLEMELN